MDAPDEDEPSSQEDEALEKSIKGSDGEGSDKNKSSDDEGGTKRKQKANTKKKLSF